jgi:hypothetical protein
VLARRLIILLGATALVATSCSDSDNDSLPPTTSVAAPASTRANEPNSASGESMTAPRDATQELRDLLGTPGPTVERADELALAVARGLIAGAGDCEAGPPTATVVSVTPGEPTFAVIEFREGCDDSVAGVRYDLAMEGDDSSGWGIVAATRQDVCRRGEGGGALCV